MGTRSGDIDHSIVFYMVNTLGYSLEAVNLLLKESGMLGLTGFSDLREIELQAEENAVSISIRYECIPN
jgi:acetate kinase